MSKNYFTVVFVLIVIIAASPARAGEAAADPAAATFTFTLSQVLSALIVALGGLGGIWKLAHTWAKKKVEETLAVAEAKAVAAIESTFGEKSGLVSDIIAEADTRRRLRRNGRVLVVNNDGRRNGVWARLRALGFCHIDVVASGDYADERGREYDAVVLERFEAEVINTFVQASTRKTFLVYHVGPPLRLAGPVFARVTFANSPISLLANVMVVLEYQDAINGDV